MKMKRIICLCIAAALLSALCLTLPGCARHTPKHLVYTDDYPTIYATELQQIFGDYVLGARTDRHIEGEYCDCGYHQDTIDCWEWEITYTDAQGRSMRCTLNNRETLYAQQVEWLQDQIETHFYDEYVLRDFDGLMDGSGCYCFCFVGRVCNGVRNCDLEERANVQTGEHYLEALRKNEQPIPLSSLPYAELFSRYPMRISIQVRLKSSDPQGYADALQLLDRMAEEIAGEIGDDLNLEAAVLIDGGSRDNVYYLSGEKALFNDALDFQHAVFRTYKGKFW